MIKDDHEKSILFLLKGVQLFQADCLPRWFKLKATITVTTLTVNLLTYRHGLKTYGHKAQIR